MKLAPYWFAPPYQPHEGSTVEFHLKPLNMPTFWALQRSMDKRKVPEWDGVEAAFAFSVLDWRGIPGKTFSAEEKAKATVQMDRDFAIWLYQIAGELYANSILKDDDAKN